MEADDTSATSSSKAQNFVEPDEYVSKYILVSMHCLILRLLISPKFSYDIL